MEIKQQENKQNEDSISPHFVLDDLESYRKKNIATYEYIFTQNLIKISFKVLKVDYSNMLSLIMFLNIQKNDKFLTVCDHQYHQELLDFIEKNHITKDFLNQKFDLKINCPKLWSNWMVNNK